MFNTTPQRALELAKQSPNEEHIVFSMQRQGNEYYLKNLNLSLKTEHITDFIDTLEEASGISVTPEQAKQLLALYPRTRVKLIDGGSGNSDTNEEITYSISHFLLGCEWPKNRDQINIDEFIALLHKQAINSGFKVTIKEEQ